MPATQFDRDRMARWYAEEHLKTDPGIREVYYLPANAGDREIRLVEVNGLLSDRNQDALEPIDFGVDRGLDTAHQLLVLDVTPAQWEQIASGDLRLPERWSLDDSVRFADE